MAQETEEARQIQQITGLKPQHFADFIRAAQLVFDPAGGLTGRRVEVDWNAFEMSPGVVENLKSLGQRYRYASPHLPVEVVWEQLTPETRSWLIENKNNLWRIEENFPALDED
jgi:hypothetical protein